MIEVEGLTKRYGRFLALSDLSFVAQRGEILGFLGPNGAGKTTTMRILTGYMPATSGTARIAGHDVFKDSVEVRRRVGYMPENVPLYQEMTVRDYLGHMAAIRGVSRKERKARVDEVMEMVRITERANDIIGHLSKGYRQRVGLGQALVHQPEVLILDEPTEGLDPRQIIDVRELIVSLRGSRTIILCSHILPEVSHICERVIIINNGRVLAVDEPRNLETRLSGTERLRLTIRGPAEEVATKLAGVPGVSDVSRRHEDGEIVEFEVQTDRSGNVQETVARTVVDSGWGLRALSTVEMSLEEIYLAITYDEKGVEAQ